MTTKHYSHYTTYDAAAGQWVYVIDGKVRYSLSETEMTLAGNFVPRTSEMYDIGSSSSPWSTAYLKNLSTVADKRHKDDLGVIDGEQALAFIQALEPRLFRFKDTVVPEKSESITVGEMEPDGTSRMVTTTVVRPETVVPHNRPHAGFFAQQVKDAMTAAGIEDCGVYAYDQDKDTHELRMLEMIAFLVRGMQALMTREAADPVPSMPMPVIQEPERKRDDLLDFDADAPEELTGDMLLSAFEHDETETAAVVQTLSATRLRHLSEQLNVERARLDREHQLTGFANPRAASIDRLIGLLTRRGEV
jgi:hypothetical protein